MEEYYDIEGTFTYEEVRPMGKLSSGRFLGWQPDERILWLIPIDTSFRSDHITGSNRSQPLFVDSIQSIRKVSGIRQGLEIQWRDLDDDRTTTSRILESRRQGKASEVEYLLRAAWDGWRPTSPVRSAPSSKQLTFSVDGETLPTSTSLTTVAMWYLEAPSTPHDWTLTIEEIKAAVEEKYGKRFGEIENFEVEIFGHSLSREFRDF